MRLIRAATSTIAIAVAIAGDLSAALAQASNVCTQLEARLAQVERSGSVSVDAGRTYDRPIAQQRQEIERATAQARRLNCIGGFVLFQPRTRDPGCDRLLATLDAMRANLRRLSNARSTSAGDPFAFARARSDILRSMQANRCGAGDAGPQYVYTNRDNQFGRGLFATLFGQPFQTYDQSFPSDSGGLGTYRTLCVRTCDGYYFPISFSTVPSQFSADAQTCQQMCPGAQAELYTYRNPGGDVSEMVSISGEAYTSLPNAFLYRREYDKSCSCGSVSASLPQFTQFDTNGTIAPPDGSVSAVTAATPMPRIRPGFGEDPETVANRAGGLVPKPADSGAEATASEVTTDNGKTIRLVGPAYYYAE